MSAPRPALDDLRDRFIAAQLAGARRDAVRLIAVEGPLTGATIAELRVDVVQAAQREIGLRWQRNEVTIAQEHMATAIAQIALTALYDRAPLVPRVGRTLVLGCVEGEIHDLPARFVADVLDLAGFDVRFLGANVPHHALVAIVTSQRPDAVGLSVTMSANVPSLRTAVAQLRAAGVHALFAGGQALAWAPRLAAELGIEHGGDSPEAQIAVARRVTGLPAIAAGA